MKILINKPSISQLRKLKQGLEIRVKSGNDIELECINDDMYQDIKKHFDKGKTYTILFDIQTNKIISKNPKCYREQSDFLQITEKHNNKCKEDIYEDKETLKKIMEILDNINSVDEYMNFANTLFENEDKIKDKTILSTIMSLKTLKNNTPYMISYNQYHMISVEILKNIKGII